LLTLSACATPILHPSEVELTELDFGVYAKSGDGYELLSTTDKVPCRPDAIFGVRVRLAVHTDRKVRLAVAGEIREPEIPGVRPAFELTQNDPVSLPKGPSSIDVAVVDEFKGEFDLVDGEYEVRVVDPRTGLAYHSRIFTLRDCE